MRQHPEPVNANAPLTPPAGWGGKEGAGVGRWVGRGVGGARKPLIVECCSACRIRAPDPALPQKTRIRDAAIGTRWPNRGQQNPNGGGGAAALEDRESRNTIA